ncbi:MFS transporter [Saccharopolyspora sp. WRP15-2]|uniref:MFS transporter n=1 Tax=Saccharopolyspora oryzae TaxID=2997343 RepID=A0ABT4UWR8_9PSEU|nr:MFS transporter [Saccharopolyspora oryzae]MDA3626158.1 MFS transporter [Saccharopolyspora oryzae]
MTRFHLRATAYTAGGMFVDGYILGVIGFALDGATPELGLSSWWTGLLGGAALAGIFLGSLIAGWITDRVGRQKMLVGDLSLFIVLSIAQLFVANAEQLLVLRLLIGIAIGADYAIGAALLSEIAPRRQRGGLLASLNAVWTFGFVAALTVGAVFANYAPDQWRWLLASSALPAAAVLALRLGTPESPRWLVAKGRLEEARQVVAKYWGSEYGIDDLVGSTSGELARYKTLFSRRYRTRTAFAALFWFCQVVPYFALFTFLPQVLTTFGLSGFVGEISSNLFLLLGAIVGVVIMDRISRRRFVIWSFAVLAVALGLLGVIANPPPLLVVVCFAVFAAVVTAAGNLETVYPSEIFPTEVRSSGVGLAAAVSRVGAAVGTFLLPTAIEGIGTGPTMLIATSVLLLGLVTSWAWAPETRHLSLARSSAAEAPVKSRATP